MVFLLIVIIAAVILYMFIKEQTKPKDYSVNIPIVQMTPLRRWFHVEGILNMKEAHMPLYALITPLLCMKFSTISPIMKDEQKIDELIVKLSMPYFSFLIDCVHNHRYAYALMDYSTKAGQVFFRSLRFYRRENPGAFDNLEPSKHLAGNIDSLILTIYDYIIENGDDSITIQDDIVPFMETWCDVYFFPAVALLDRLGKKVYKLNKEVNL